MSTKQCLKLLKLYHQGYSIYYWNDIVTINDDLTFSISKGVDNDLFDCTPDEFSVVKTIKDWLYI